MNATFGMNRKQFNSTGVDNAVLARGCTVYLKETTSILSPTLIVSDHDIAQGETGNFNYFEFSGRYYWIADIRHFTNHICEIDGKVDVLGTYRNRILQSKAFVTHTNSTQTGYYNPLLEHSKIARSMQAEFVAGDMASIPFFSSNGCFVVSALSKFPNSSDTGVPELFLLTGSELDALQQRLAAPDLWQKVKDVFYSPSEGIIACKWIPLDIGSVSGSSAQIGFADFEDLGTGKNIAQKNITADIMVTMDYPYSDENGYYDYRNHEPFSEYAIWLPGVGLMDFPSILATDTPSSAGMVMNVKAVLSIPTGKISYQISVGNMHNIVKVCTGDVSVDIPIGKQTNGFGAGFAGLVNSAGSMAIALITKNPGLALSMETSAAVSATQASFAFMQHGRTASGSIGGWTTPAELMNNVFVVRTSYQASDTPQNSYEVIGRPYFKTVQQLEQLVGCKVWISDINVQQSGGTFSPTYEEWQELLRLIRSEQGVFLEM